MDLRDTQGKPQVARTDSNGLPADDYGLPPMAPPRSTFAPRDTPSPRERAWESEALCRGSDELFCRKLNESEAERVQRERAAKQVCGICPVREECLDYALRVRELVGVWGGLNALERLDLMRERS